MFAKTITMSFPHHLFFFKSIIFFIHGILFRKLWNARGNFNRSLSNINVPTSHHSKFQRFTSLFTSKSNLSGHAMIFNVEETLLKSSSNLFPYYMLVAFEGGSIIRAFILFLMYPIICLLDEDMGVKIMVMVCFFGVRKKSFRVGSSVLPAFFLEDVGLEGFEVLNKCDMKVGVSSSFPQVMIESFLRDYMEVDVVVGRQLKEFHGYFLGLMEEKRSTQLAMEEIFGEETCDKYRLIGMNSFKKFMDHHHNQLFSLCKEIYLVSKADKGSWHHLPKNSYPKPLIFHDGRLALKPTPFSTLSLFMWLPFSFVISILRIIIALSLPFNIALPTLTFLGIYLTVSISNNPSNDNKSSQIGFNSNKSLLYVCNHRTLLDPLYLSFSLKRKITAVTYSLSRLSEIIAPIRTVRLTRNRDQDKVMMENMLKQGDLVVCPEGTTCREPYLLRFSPLFAEMSEELVPVAVDTHVGMFHGTTASGYKCLDPLFFLMNPNPSYKLTLLDKVSGLMSLNLGEEKSRFDVANHVQSEIGNVLGFKCTKLTRKDKYMILAGNEGISR